MWQWLRALRNRSAVDDRPLPYVDPLRAGRHPFQIYMLALCVLASLPFLFGYATAEAVEKQLPLWLAFAWGMTMLFGASVALLGSFWSGSIANALTMERFGLAFTGGAALVYGLCVVGARSAVAPLFVVGVYVGYLLLRVPVTRWSDHTNQRVADLMTGGGVLLMLTSGAALAFTPAVVVLTGAFIILGFGLSCLTRAKDIAAIFHRANDPHAAPILRESRPTTEGD